MKKVIKFFGYLTIALIVAFPVVLIVLGKVIPRSNNDPGIGLFIWLIEGVLVALFGTILLVLVIINALIKKPDVVIPNNNLPKT